MHWFHNFFELVEDIVHVKAEAKVIDAAVAIALDLKRPEVRTVLEQAGACHHHHDPKRIALRRRGSEALAKNLSKESSIVFRALEIFCADEGHLRLLQRVH